MTEWRAYPKVNADGSGARNSWFPTDDILSNNFESGNGSVNTAAILKKKKPPKINHKKHKGSTDCDWSFPT